MTWRRTTWLVVVLVASPGIFAGCRGDDAPARPLDHVKAVVLPYLTFGPIFIAQDEGFFRGEHLEVEFVKLQKVSEGIPSLAQGRLDVLGGSVTTGFLNAVARGARIRAVANKGYVTATGCVANGILARTDLLASGKLTLSGSDRLVMAVDRASYSFFYADRALEQAGLNIDRVEQVDLPDALLSEAFKSRRIDLAATAEPWISRNLETGEARLWKAAGAIIPDFQHAFLFFGPTLLDQRPEVGRRFVRAYLKGVRQYEQGRSKRNVQIMLEHTGLDPTLLEQSCWPAFKTDGAIDVQSILEYQMWGRKRGLIDTELRADQFTDLRFLELVQPGTRGH